jgi:hypothetical protein
VARAASAGGSEGLRRTAVSELFGASPLDDGDSFAGIPPAPGSTSAAAWPARVFLYSRQQPGHRHSSVIVPSGRFTRESRHPNCALISV